MATEELKARAFHETSKQFVAQGRAPHYSELASVLGTSPLEALEAQREAAAAGIGGWFEPDTDYIASWAPFSNIPTHHRISVDGGQRWSAQCWLEAFAASWLFPGQGVRIDSRCLDCGDPIWATMRDGELLDRSDQEMVVCINVPFDEIATPLNPDGTRSLPLG